MRGKAAGLQARLQMLLEEDAALHDLMQHYGQAVGCLRLLQAIGAHEAAHQEDMVRLGRLTLPLSLTLPPTPTPTPNPNPNPTPAPNPRSPSSTRRPASSAPTGAPRCLLPSAGSPAACSTSVTRH